MRFHPGTHCRRGCAFRRQDHQDAQGHRWICKDMQNKGLKGECLPAQIPHANTKRRLCERIKGTLSNL